MPEWPALIERVRTLHVLDGAASAGTVWLWDYVQRVVRNAELLASVPELSDDPPDRIALMLAALFANVGWAMQVRDGAIMAEQILERPTNPVQRDLAVSALQEHGGDAFEVEIIMLAAEAIRQCSDHYTSMPEARVLADAESLADIGVPYLLGLFRRYQNQSRGLTEMITSWQRQHEYSFWDARINDGLRFEISRRIARERLEAADRCMQALAVQNTVIDLRAALTEAGIELPPAQFQEAASQS